MAINPQTKTAKTQSPKTKHNFKTLLNTLYKAHTIVHSIMTEQSKCGKPYTRIQRMQKEIYQLMKEVKPYV